MIFSPTYSKVALALLAVQREVQPIVKDAVNPLLKNRYATLDATMDYVRPVLAKHELVVLQGVGGEHYHPTTGILTTFTVETTLLHSSGEWVRNSVVVPVAEIGKEERRTTAQTAGGSLTYGRRYSLCAILALTTDEDDDGNGPAPRAKSRQRTQAQTAPRSAQEANARSVTKLAELPFPQLKGLEQYKGMKLADVPEAKIAEALQLTRAHSGKNAKMLTTAFEDYLEGLRALNDFTQPLPPEAPDNLPF